MGVLILFLRAAARSRQVGHKTYCDLRIPLRRSAIKPCGARPLSFRKRERFFKSNLLAGLCPAIYPSLKNAVILFRSAPQVRKSQS
jgi:hypothetical protein